MYITGPINSLSFKIRQVVLDIYPSPFPSTTLHYYRLSPYLSSLLATTTIPPVLLRLATRNHCQSSARACVCMCIYIVCTCVCNKSTFVTKRAGKEIRFYCVLRLPVAKRGVGIWTMKTVAMIVVVVVVVKKGCQFRIFVNSIVKLLYV